MLRSAWRSLALAIGAWAATLASPAAAAPSPPAAELSGTVFLDSWSNLQGGLKRGSAALLSAQLGLEIDGETALGWPGGTLAVSAIANDRPTISGDFVGDLHGIDNREARRGAQLFEAWARQAFPGGYAKLGVIDLNAEFSVNRTGAVFINGAVGLGLETAQLGWDGPSIYPRTRAGALLAFERGGGWKLGLFSGARDPDGPERGDTPFLALLETARKTPTGGRLTLGVWRHSVEYGATLMPVAHRAASGGYLLVEQPVWRGRVRGLDVFARIGIADAKTEQIASDVHLGAVLDRPFLGREGEALGVAVLTAANGDHARRMSTGREPLARRETVLEATWRVPLARGLAVQPDVQYVRRPGALVGARDALVVGVRLEALWRAALSR